MAHRIQQLKKKTNDYKNSQQQEHLEITNNYPKQISKQTQPYFQEPNHNKNILNNQPKTQYPPQYQPENRSNSPTRKAAIPRPIHPPQKQAIKHDKSSYKKGKFAFPPVDTVYFSQNTYDAGPQFIRPTSALITSTKKYNYPIGVWITPFGSDQVHTIKVSGPLRCQRCRAYINPYFRHDGNNKTSNCNICGIRFAIPQTTDKNNFVAQVATQGVIDFVVTQNYYKRKRQDLIKVILGIEMTAPMIQTGLFRSIIDSIKSTLQSSNFQSAIRFGIVYYNDDGVNFSKFKKNSPNQQNIITYSDKLIEFQVNTKTGVFCCPLSDKQFLYNPNNQQQKQRFLKLLDAINAKAENYYKNGKYLNLANYISVIKCLEQGFQNQTGRILLFTHLQPRSPPCAIRGRNQQEQKNLMRPINTEYLEVSKSLLNNKIGVQHFIFSKEQVVPHELATTQFLTSVTGGNTYLYSPYIPQNHSQNLYYTIYKCLTKQTVYDIDLTCRVSSGLSINQFLMFDSNKEVRDVALSIMDPSQSIAVSFMHQEKIQENAGACVQFAMMFTNGNGQRKIRVINYKYGISDKIQAIHQSSDYLTFANIICRQYLHKLKNTEPMKVRQQFINKLVNILVQYKQQSAIQKRFTQLNIHPHLSPALAYLHSVFNSRLFLNSLKTPADYKTCEVLKICSFGFLPFALRYYPQIYPLTMDIYDQQPLPGDFYEQNDEIAILPQNLPVQRGTFKENGVYLYNNGQYMIIFVMHSAPRDLLQQLFGTQDWEQIESQGLPQLQTAHNIRVNNMVNEIRRKNTKNNGIYLPLLVRTPLRKAIFNDLIATICKQDFPQLNYYGFLDYLHKLVQSKGK